MSNDTMTEEQMKKTVTLAVFAKVCETILVKLATEIEDGFITLDSNENKLIFNTLRKQVDSLEAEYDKFISSNKETLDKLKDGTISMDEAEKEIKSSSSPTGFRVRGSDEIN